MSASSSNGSVTQTWKSTRRARTSTTSPTRSVVSRITVSICVRERYADDAGEEHARFGVAVTTQIPAIGELCPFANESGVVAVQARCTGDPEPRIIAYLADGFAIRLAVPALLDADDTDEQLRQVHGLDRDGAFCFSESEALNWYGHRKGTAAGNLLVGEEVLEAMGGEYERGDRRLAARFVDALEAGYEAGGDRREDVDVQSAALVVADTSAPFADSYYNDLWTDATKTPIEDLRESYRLGAKGNEICTEKYDC